MELNAIRTAIFGSSLVNDFGHELLKKMTLEEKVGQLLMVHFNGEKVNEDAKTLVQQAKVGGVIYYNWSNGLHSPQQVHDLSCDLQKLVEANQHPIPLLIAADQEGGVVSRLNNGFTQFPGNRALGETQDQNLAEEAAFVMGKELRAVGVNMNLAPVVDVNSHPRNPVIGVRSYADEAETVHVFGEKALNGYKKAQMIATLKHFPGYGDVTVDPHEDLPVVRKSKEELERVELVPFTKLAPIADVVMTAHILVPALDPENCSTLSEKTLNYLREKIGFKGVIIADSLVMDGVVKKCGTVDEAAIQALKAGCDILILGGKLLNGQHGGFELNVADVQRIHGAIIDAVKIGRISEARVNEAAIRILKLKERYLNVSSRSSDNDLRDCVNTMTHRLVAQKIASKSVKTIVNVPHSIQQLSTKKICVFAPELVHSVIDQAGLSKIGKTTKLCFFSQLSPLEDEINRANSEAEAADALVVCSYNAWKNPPQVTFIQSLLETKKPIVIIVMRDPLDASLFPTAHLIFKTFSPTAPSLQAICDQLNEKR